jgi:hypothetical protein
MTFLEFCEILVLDVYGTGTPFRRSCGCLATLLNTPKSRVVDPDPFEPPGSGSFHHQAK